MRKLERTVAIKILPPGMLIDEEARKRFHQETLAKVSHANIAGVFDAGEQDGVDYIAMKFVPGQPLAAIWSLARLLKRTRLRARCRSPRRSGAHEHGMI